MPSSPLNRYFQVKRADVRFNTIVNCKSAFDISYGTSSDQQLAVIESVISDNLVYNQSSSNYVLTLSMPESEVKYQNNIFNQGKFKNTTFIGIFNAEPNQELVQSMSGILEPMNGSPLDKYYSINNGVKSDIFGRIRANESIPGCSEPGKPTAWSMPQKAQTGADWFVGVR